GGAGATGDDSWAQQGVPRVPDEGSALLRPRGDSREAATAGAAGSGLVGWRPRRAIAGRARDAYAPGPDLAGDAGAGRREGRGPLDRQCPIPFPAAVEVRAPDQPTRRATATRRRHLGPRGEDPRGPR